MRYSSVCLFSGGIDSYILLEYIKKNIDPNTQPVYFNIGHRYVSQELEIIKRTKNVIIDDSIKIGDLEQDSAFIPNRNILLTTLAVSKYSNKVFIGGSKSDRVADNNDKVFNDLSKLLTTTFDSGEVITITSPFWDVYKDNMILWYMKNKSDILFKNTFSCYQPCIDDHLVNVYNLNNSKYEKYLSKHCFNCRACFRRNAALYNTGYVLPFNLNNIDSLEQEFQNNIDLNPNDLRSDRTIKYIKRIKDMYIYEKR